MAARSLIVANWKMHPTTRVDAKQLFAAVKRIAEKIPVASIIVAPPMVYISELARGYKGRSIAFAAQHAHEGDAGAFTGEISMAQIKDAGAKYVIVGHAERRAAGESEEDVGRQVASAVTKKLAPILCIGERTRGMHGEHLVVIKEQLRAALLDVVEGDIPKIIIAYEPVWAIGAAEPMSPTQMHEMVIFIRKMIVEMKGQAGLSTKILYGGSIDDTSAKRMLDEGEVGGLLVGRASTDPVEFTALINSLAKK